MIHGTTSIVVTLQFSINTPYTPYTPTEWSEKKSTRRKFFTQPDVNPLSDSSNINTNSSAVRSSCVLLSQCIYLFDIFLPINVKYFPKLPQHIVYHEYAVCLLSVRDIIFMSVTWDSYFQKFNNVLRVSAVAPNTFHCFKVVQSS